MSEPSAHRQRSGWRRLVSPKAVARLALLAGLCPLAGWLGGAHWRLDLFNHFQAQYFGFLLLCAGVLVAWRQWRLALIPAALLLVPAWRLAPLYLPAKGTAAAPGLRAASFNVLTQNKRYDDAVDWIRRTDPDFIYLPETDPIWNERLDALSDRWRHKLDYPVVGNFGSTLRSKHPITDDRTERIGRLQVPLIHAVIETPRGAVTVLGAHPVPPVSEFWARERDDYLAHVAELAGACDGRVIVLGDLNATRWSRAMQPFFEAGLHDTAEGHGFHGTWDPNFRLLRIPIDHVLTRGFPENGRREIGPDLGSDHRPVVVELAW